MFGLKVRNGSVWLFICKIFWKVVTKPSPTYLIC